MAKFTDLPAKTQMIVIVVLGLAVTGLLFWFVMRGLDSQNRDMRTDLESKNAEIAKLEAYQPKLKKLEADIEGLKAQIEIQKRIVPDEKEAPQFIHLLQDTAAASNVEIRRYTAKAVQTREFYTEVPWEMEIDGPFWGVQSFFEKTAKQERIININTLLMATTDKPADAKVKRRYQYRPGDSVAATFVATSFFSSENQPAPAPPAPAKK